MRYLTVVFVAAIFLSGCAQEAYYADQEYGLATMDAFDQQIVHKDYKHADKSVDGMDGLHSEPTMEMYHDSFGEGFTVGDVGSVGGGVGN